MRKRQWLASMAVAGACATAIACGGEVTAAARSEANGGAAGGASPPPGGIARSVPTSGGSRTAGENPLTGCTSPTGGTVATGGLSDGPCGDLTQQAIPIAGQEGDCVYQVPPGSTDNPVVDLQHIAVTYVPSGGAPRALSRAADSSCQSGQWYVSAVDSNGNPTECTLCPDPCAAASGDPGVRIDVALVCMTTGY